jgi:hypothetical protein
MLNALTGEVSYIHIKKSGIKKAHSKVRFKNYLDVHVTLSMVR